MVQEYQYDDYDDDIELMDSSEEEEVEEEDEDGGDLLSMITGFMKPDTIKYLSCTILHRLIYIL